MKPYLYSRRVTIAAAMTPENNLPESATNEHCAPLPLEKIAQTPLGAQLDLDYLGGRARPGRIIDHPLGDYLIPEFGMRDKILNAFPVPHIRKLSQGGVGTLRELLEVGNARLKELDLKPDDIKGRVENIFKYVVGPGPEGLFVTFLVSSANGLARKYSVALPEIVEAERNKIVAEILAKLDLIQKTVVWHRFGFNRGIPETLNETARLAGTDVNKVGLAFVDVVNAVRSDVGKVERYYSVL